MVMKASGKKRKATSLQPKTKSEARRVDRCVSRDGGSHTRRPSKLTSDADELSGLARKFVTGLASRLAKEDAVDMEAAFQAAIAALPGGNLKKELRRCKVSTLLQLAVGADTPQPTTPLDTPTLDGPTGSKVVENEAKDVPHPMSKRSTKKASDEPGQDELVDRPQGPHAKSRSHGRSDHKQLSTEDPSTGSCSPGANPPAAAVRSLRARALNPGVHPDLLIQAMGDGEIQGSRDSGSGSGLTLDEAIARLETLARALAVDPQAALSPSLRPFYADRAANLAASIQALVLSTAPRGCDGHRRGGLVESTTLALKLILRVLLVATLTTGPSPANASQDGDEDPGTHPATIFPGNSGRAEELLRSVSARVQGLLLESDGRDPRPEALAVSRDTGEPGLSPFQLSIARLLAHYAVTVAALCAATGWEARALGLVRDICTASGARAKAQQVSRLSGDSDDEEDDDDDEGEDGVEGRGTGDASGARAQGAEVVVARHVAALCCVHLAGDEEASLEFVRRVGDACFAPTGAGNCKPPPPLPPSTAASLAAACATALSQVPRAGTPTSAPSATLLLRRAYASRVVDSLISTSARGKGAAGRCRRAAASMASAARDEQRRQRGSEWVVPALGELLGSLGGPGVSRGMSGLAKAALLELESRRDKPSDILELLRSSAACGPRALNGLLRALEDEATAGAFPGVQEGNAGGLELVEDEIDGDSARDAGAEEVSPELDGHDSQDRVEDAETLPAFVVDTAGDAGQDGILVGVSLDSLRRDSSGDGGEARAAGEEGEADEDGESTATEYGMGDNGV